VPDTILTRIRRAWNIFRFGDNYDLQDIGSGYGYRQDRLLRMVYNSEGSMITSIYNRIGIDVAAVGIQHVRTDENGKYLDVIDSGLNNCLTTEANIDQSGRAFIQDVVMSLCDEGSIAIVPVDTTLNPAVTGSYDILTMRVAKILQWYPEHVQVDLYNQATGMYQPITLPKTMVAIVENPLYSVMNEPNSTLRRLIEKINLLDVIDKQSGSGKLDLLIQLPYVLKTEKRIQQAENRREMIEEQLRGSQYGIAYVDATEKITQLNRPAENNLMAQIEYLTSMLWSQLGLTKEVFDGTADETAMINYWSRTIEPFLSAITDAMSRVFLTKTGRTQGQKIMAVRDPFRLVPASLLAEMADKFTRNEIVSSNEFRQVLGMKPSKDPRADELRNKNLNEAATEEESKPKPNEEGSTDNAKS